MVFVQIAPGQSAPLAGAHAGQQRRQHAHRHRLAHTAHRLASTAPAQLPEHAANLRAGDEHLAVIGRRRARHILHRVDRYPPPLVPRNLQHMAQQRELGRRDLPGIVTQGITQGLGAPGRSVPGLSQLRGVPLSPGERLVSKWPLSRTPATSICTFQRPAAVFLGVAIWGSAGGNLGDNCVQTSATHALHQTPSARNPLIYLRLCGGCTITNIGVVPGAGIEPALLSELDFESSASTNFATRAVTREAADYGTVGRMKYERIEDAVGHTPLVVLQRIGARDNGARGTVVLGKLEGNNPAGSVKDRPALSMISRAQERGDIRPGDTLIEATSGNTGIALVMAEDLSIERAQTMRAFGAELVLTPKSGGMEHARDLAEAMQKRGQGKVLDQFANAENGCIH